MVGYLLFSIFAMYVPEFAPILLSGLSAALPWLRI